MTTTDLILAIAIAGMIACLAIMMYRCYGQIRKRLDNIVFLLDYGRSLTDDVKCDLDRYKKFQETLNDYYRGRIDKLENVMQGSSEKSSR